MKDSIVEWEKEFISNIWIWWIYITNYCMEEKELILCHHSWYYLELFHFLLLMLESIRFGTYSGGEWTVVYEMNYERESQVIGLVSKIYGLKIIEWKQAKQR